MPCETAKNIGLELQQGKDAFDRLEDAFRDRPKSAAYLQERGVIEHELHESVVALNSHRKICHACGFKPR
jgi:hypothetical protein